MNKPFKTYEEQTAILTSRNLNIPNKDRAMSLLKSENYYNIINGYRVPFLLTKDPERYHPLASFEHIELLYDFNNNLRGLLLPILIKIENTLKAVIAYNFAEQYGEYGYLNKQNYNISKEFKLINDKLIPNIKKALLHAKKSHDAVYDCIKHYNKKGDVPIWVLVNVLNFTTLSIFYTCLDGKLKDKIAIQLSVMYNSVIRKNDLDLFFRILVQYRNMCAHGQRICNFTTKFSLSQNNHVVSTITEKHFQINYNNIISVIVIISQLSSSSTYLIVCNHIITYLNSLTSNIPIDFHKHITKFMNLDINNFQIVIRELLDLKS